MSVRGRNFSSSKNHTIWWRKTGKNSGESPSSQFRSGPVTRAYEKKRLEELFARWTWEPISGNQKKNSSCLNLDGWTVNRVEPTILTLLLIKIVILHGYDSWLEGIFGKTTVSEHHLDQSTWILPRKNDAWRTGKSLKLSRIPTMEPAGLVGFLAVFFFKSICPLVNVYS